MSHWFCSSLFSGLLPTFSSQMITLRSLESSGVKWLLPSLSSLTSVEFCHCWSCFSSGDSVLLQLQENHSSFLTYFILSLRAALLFTPYTIKFQIFSLGNHIYPADMNWISTPIILIGANSSKLPSSIPSYTRKIFTLIAQRHHQHGISKLNSHIASTTQPAFFTCIRVLITDIRSSDHPSEALQGCRPFPHFYLCWTLVYSIEDVGLI